MFTPLCQWSRVLWRLCLFVCESVCLSVCLYVCARVRGTAHLNLCVVHVAISMANVIICYIFPVLWMTSCFLIAGPMIQVTQYIVSSNWLTRWQHRLETDVYSHWFTCDSIRYCAHRRQHQMYTTALLYLYNAVKK